TPPNAPGNRVQFGRHGLQALILTVALTFTAVHAATTSVPGIPITVAADFRVEVVYRVPRDQGSWVSLAVDAKGRFITSDQFGKLYRVTLDAEPARPPRIEPIDVNLGSAQGLLWAFDSLYVVANRDKDHGGSGLYRL